MIELKFKKLYPDAILPTRGSPDAVGWDLYMYYKSHEDKPLTKVLPSLGTFNFGTGILIEPPPGYFVMVCSRSGLGKHGLFVTNAPGIIDPDYRGEVRVLMQNGNYSHAYFKHGDRIAQLVVVKATPVEIVEVQTLSPTERGEKGLGSTGT